MLRERRFEYIIKGLETKDLLTYEDMALGTGVSEDTIRRDIDLLHKNGLLSKVRGGAMKRSKNPLTFQDRNTHLKDEKRIIALKSQQFIHDGMTIFMDGGTTICAIVNYLPINSRLRIVTSNVMLVPILANYPNVELVLLGGQLNKETASTVGAAAAAQVEDYVADLYLMGTCGVDTAFGVSAVVAEDAVVKRAMVKSAKLIVALANQERLGLGEPFKICPLDKVDVLITNLDTTDDILDPFRNQSLTLI